MNPNYIVVEEIDDYLESIQTDITYVLESVRKKIGNLPSYPNRIQDLEALQDLVETLQNTITELSESCQ